MKPTITLILFFFTANLFSETEIKAKIISFKGNVEISFKNQKVKPSSNKEISLDSIIKTGKSGKIDLIINGLYYSIKENQNIEIKKFNEVSFYLSETTKQGNTQKTYSNNLNKLILENGEARFKKYLEKKVKDEIIFKDWKEIIELSFNKLISNSKNEPFNYQYAIIDDQGFNAESIAGGYFIVSTGTLETIDAYVSKNSDYRKNQTQTNKNQIREYYIAAILAHELAHYYNRHAFIAGKRIIKKTSELDGSEKELEFIRSNQELELDADLTGLSFFLSANYEKKWFENMLIILKDLDSEQAQIQNLFFQTHPSPNERLSKMQDSKQELYTVASKLEKTFADIQLGRSLDSSLKIIENALETYPINTNLLEAKALCLHKMWLNDVSPLEQKLRAILNPPAFMSDLILKMDTRKGEEKIPGNKKKYYDAIEAYEKAYLRTLSPISLSNYSTLLLYDKDKRKLGLEYANQAYKTILIRSIFNDDNILGSVALLNNYSVALYWNKEYKKASNELSGFIGKIKKLEEVINKDLDYKRKIKKGESISQQINPVYVSDFSTLYLNQAIIEFETGDLTKGKEFAQKYLEERESISNWSKYLALLNGIQLPPRIKIDDINSDNFSLGDNLESVEKRLGKAYESRETINFIEGEQIVEKAILYREKGISLYFLADTLISFEIYYNSQESLKNGLKIGTSKEELVKILGKRYKTYLLFGLLYEGENVNISIDLNLQNSVNKITVKKTLD